MAATMYSVGLCSFLKWDIQFSVWFVITLNITLLVPMGMHVCIAKNWLRT